MIGEYCLAAGFYGTSEDMAAMKAKCGCSKCRSPIFDFTTRGENMEIPFTITDELRRILNEHGIQPEEYKPAYGGESVGLDLYYTGREDFGIQGAKAFVTLTDEEIAELKKEEDEDTSDGGLYVREVKALIPTGVKIALPPGYVCFVKDRGSISKTDFVRRAGVIDPGYTGEIFVNMWGAGILKHGDKLPVQLVVVKAETNFTHISNEDYDILTGDSERGEGKTGSTDKIDPVIADLHR